MRYSSGYSSGGSYSSGANNTTQAQEIISQAITFAFLPSAYSGALQTLCQNGYGTSLAIFTPATKKWALDCSVASSAARRGGAVVTFRASISANKAAGATSSAHGLSVTSPN